MKTSIISQTFIHLYLFHSPQRHGHGQIPACTVTSHDDAVRIRAQLVRICKRPPICVEAFFQCGRILGLCKRALFRKKEKNKKKKKKKIQAKKDFGMNTERVWLFCVQRFALLLYLLTGSKTVVNAENRDLQHFGPEAKVHLHIANKKPAEQVIE